MGDFEKLTHPKFEVYKDKAGEFRFRLKDKNGGNIGKSEGYKRKDSCMNGIASVGKNAPDAKIEEPEEKNAPVRATPIRKLPREDAVSENYLI